MRVFAPILQLITLIFLTSAALAQAPAETIVSGLSENHVSITTDFAGSQILIYGAIKRDTPAPQGTLEVIVSVEGPTESVDVWRKDRMFGIWINDISVGLQNVPSFYAIATTGPLNHILSEQANFDHNITIDRVILTEQGKITATKMEELFINALIRIRSAAGKYRIQEGAVDLTEQTLFRTDIALPASLTEGEYRVRLFLLREGQVIATQDRLIGVYRAGLEQFVYNLAHTQPLIYGLVALVIAAVAGWAASAVFRFIR